MTIDDTYNSMRVAIANATTLEELLSIESQLDQIPRGLVWANVRSKLLHLLRLRTTAILGPGTSEG